jgi:uncharacterized integral membrane protein
VKAIRIAQVIALVLLAIYLWVFHNVNPEYISLPLAISMPPALIVLIAIILTWFIAWLPARTKVWRLQRRLKQVTQERDALAARFAPHGHEPGDGPVIPDRIDPYATGSGSARRGDDPTDYL